MDHPTLSSRIFNLAVAPEHKRHQFLAALDLPEGEIIAEYEGTVGPARNAWWREVLATYEGYYVPQMLRVREEHRHLLSGRGRGHETSDPDTASLEAYDDEKIRIFDEYQERVNAANEAFETTCNETWQEALLPHLEMDFLPE